MKELAEAVLAVTGSSSDITHVPLPQDDPKQRCPDITKAKRILSWEPKTQLREGLEATVEYYREQLQKGSL